MRADPFQPGLRPLFHQRPCFLDQLKVFHRALFALPAPLLPTGRPLRQRVHDELAVRIDGDLVLGRQHLQPCDHRHQLHAVVGRRGVVAVLLGDDLAAFHPHGAPAARPRVPGAGAVREHAGIWSFGEPLQDLGDRQVQLTRHGAAGASRLRGCLRPRFCRAPRDARAAALQTGGRRPVRILRARSRRNGERVATVCAGEVVAHGFERTGSATPGRFCLSCLPATSARSCRRRAPRRRSKWPVPARA